MHFQFEVAPPPAAAVLTPSPPAPPANEAVELLRELLAVQREQLQQAKAAAAAHDAAGRWRAFLQRWQDEFPNLPESCKDVLPILERAYLGLLSDLTGFLKERGPDPLDNEFALGEFLDRYGMRLGQLGGILSTVAPLAEAAMPPADPAA